MYIHVQLIKIENNKKKIYSHIMLMIHIKMKKIMKNIVFESFI